MCDSFELIRESLCAAAQRYHAVVEGGRLRPREWAENVKLLKPIAKELQQVANTQIVQCQTELEEKERAKLRALSERAEQYDLIEQKKSALSALDAEVIDMMAQIEHISDDITKKQGELKGCQEKICAGKKKKKKWNTVFWATCWIPFVNIGTGCKKADADAEYYAKAKRLGEEIDALKAQSRSPTCHRDQQPQPSNGSMDVHPRRLCGDSCQAGPCEWGHSGSAGVF